PGARPDAGSLLWRHQTERHGAGVLVGRHARQLHPPQERDDKSQHACKAMNAPQRIQLKIWKRSAGRTRKVWSGRRESNPRHSAWEEASWYAILWHMDIILLPLLYE